MGMLIVLILSSSSVTFLYEDTESTNAQIILLTGEGNYLKHM